MPPSREPRLAVIDRKPRVVVFAESRDGHAGRLMRALRARGAEVRRASLGDCAIDTTQRVGIVIPGFARRLPDMALVRTIPDGTFEAVTRRLGILHALRELGVVVWNDARAIERCVDKSATSFHLARAGIATPDTWAVETESQAREIVRREMRKGPLVYKPLFGSQGRGIRLLRGEDDLPSAEEARGVYYLQRFVGEDRGGYSDYRVFVVSGRAIAAMSRHHSDWITNVKRGGVPRSAPAEGELARLAERAAGATGAAYCGVDVICPPASEPLVLEVNSMPAWSGLQKVSERSISGCIAEALLAAGSRLAPRLAG